MHMGSEDLHQGKIVIQIATKIYALVLLRIYEP